MPYFKSVEKVAKTHAKKVINKKVTENLSFWHFLPITFLGDLFALFSTDLKSALNFGFDDTHIKL
jgi:hypothetical protein